MYGALTGLSKKMVAQQYGENLMQEWRHSYDTPPPALTSFSPFYPGNDERYVNYVKDVPISIFETVVRSLANRKFELHYQLPKTESLKNSMERTIPYFKNVIYPESIMKGKRVLIASSENAIRGLLMHLCDIPPESVPEIEIPTGLPMIYDFNLKCIKLLDDGLYKDGDPTKRYYFGKKPELLFQPCDSSSDSCYFSDDFGRSFKNDPLIHLPPDALHETHESGHNHHYHPHSSIRISVNIDNDVDSVGSNKDGLKITTNVISSTNITTTTTNNNNNVVPIDNVIL
jgi:bisphosphoglycerate-dependent phosphoglycerate mutase family 1